MDSESAFEGRYLSYALHVLHKSSPERKEAQLVAVSNTDTAERAAPILLDILVQMYAELDASSVRIGDFQRLVYEGCENTIRVFQANALKHGVRFEWRK